MGQAIHDGKFVEVTYKVIDGNSGHVLTVSRRDPETGEYTMEKAPCYHLVSDAAEARVEHH